MPTENLPQLSVVIPTLNERENLELLLPALHEACADLNLDAEILVVDGGSKDGTREIAARRRARVIDQKKRGFGGALEAGFHAARAPYVVAMDADLSHRPSFLGEFWKRRDEAQMLIASRFVPGGAADMSRFRLALSLVLNAVYRRVLCVPYQDLSSGYRMYRRDLVAPMDLKSRNFEVQQEILLKAWGDGRCIVEVPFRYMPRATGKSHVHLLKFGWAYCRSLFEMWQLRKSITRRPSSIIPDAPVQTASPTLHSR